MKVLLNLIVLFASVIVSGMTGAYGVEPDKYFKHVKTDKSAYAPGDIVHIELQMIQTQDNKTVSVCYKYLNQLIEQKELPVSNTDSLTWSWQPPDTDFSGYMIEIYLTYPDSIYDFINIAVDVSSDWSKFPRYGFLSKFPYLSQANVASTLSRLARFHINGLQFYDWHYKHHLPLKGTLENPASSWPDIANRTNYFSTIARYIDTAHQYNMKAMAYNLLFGAYENAHLDGVSPGWRLFKDKAHTIPDKHDLPDNWASDIYLMDPSNNQWKNYIYDKMRGVFLALPFDGWHVDQLGDRGTLYNDQGDIVNLKETYQSFMQQASGALNVDLVMNAVNQYGQTGIAKSPVEFLYTEVWDPNSNYSALASIIINNSRYSDASLSTVLAAYVNKGLSGNPGYMNTPSVLLADAVIFAAGGSHLELGEHMLCNEYFPNDNLKMSDELTNQLTCYYDFLVAYQNLLRDGGEFNQKPLHSTGSIAIKSWVQKGSVWAFAKKKDNRQIFHLINFMNAITLDWRDNQGIQVEPDIIENMSLSFIAEQKVNNIWIASPDFNKGSAESIVFTQKGDTLSFNLPRLQYWQMIVVEYEEATAVETTNESNPNTFYLGKNYPNPFNPDTRIDFYIPVSGHVKMEVFNSLGQHIQTLFEENQLAGFYSVTWHTRQDLPSGIYYCRLSFNGQLLKMRKLVLLK